jgi:hypothetical protein
MNQSKLRIENRVPAVIVDGEWRGSGCRKRGDGESEVPGWEWRSKTEWAEKGLGERVPLVGCHHEQPMATRGLLQLEGLRCFSQWEDQV